MAFKFLSTVSIPVSEFFSNKRIFGLLVFLLLLAGLLLRTYRVDRFPIDNLDDGVYYVWAGVSFWQNPFEVTSLTLFDSDNERLFWRAEYLDFIPGHEFGYRLVEPWFDHPPLGTALIGLPAFLLGYHVLDNVPFSVVRLPAVLASIATLYFSFRFIKELFGKNIALISLAIFSLSPYFIFAHRQSYLENVLTPFIIIAFWQGYIVYQKMQADKKVSKKRWIFLLLVTILCGWIKIIGFTIPLLLMAWFIKQKYWKAAGKFFFSFCISLVSYIGYGLLADTQGFLSTLGSQSGRGMYWGNFADILTNQSLAAVFKDSFLVLCWLAILLFIIVHHYVTAQKNISKSAIEYFSWIFISLTLIILLLSGRHNAFLWYRYPLFPFLTVGIAWMIIQLWQKPQLLFSFLLVLLGWSQLYVVLPTFITGELDRYIVLATLAVPFLFFIFDFKKEWKSLLQKTWLIAVCTVIIITNVLVVMKFPAYYCTEIINCPLPTKIEARE